MPGILPGSNKITRSKHRWDFYGIVLVSNKIFLETLVSYFTLFSILSTSALRNKTAPRSLYLTLEALLTHTRIKIRKRVYLQIYYF